MASGVTGRVEMSRTRDLRNSCVIRGERGTLEVGTKTDSTVTLTPARGEASLSGPRDDARASSRPATSPISFAWQMADFVRAIDQPAPSVSGLGRRAAASPPLEACYRRRQPLAFRSNPCSSTSRSPLQHDREGLMMTR